MVGVDVVNDEGTSVTKGRRAVRSLPPELAGRPVPARHAGTSAEPSDHEAGHGWAAAVNGREVGSPHGNQQ